MTHIQYLGRSGTDALSEEIIAELKAMAAEKGIEISIDGFKYSDFKSTIKLKVEVANQKLGRIEAGLKAAGLEGTFGKYLLDQGRAFRIIDWDENSRFSVVGKSDDGKVRCFAPFFAKQLLEASQGEVASHLKSIVLEHHPLGQTAVSSKH